MKKVQTSKNFKMFKFLNGNRSVDNKHLKRLEKSMSEKKLFSPILVTKNMEILDGQHRFLVSKKLQLPLDFIVVDDSDGLQDVHTYNSMSKNWNADDYMNSYAVIGNENYIIYRDFKNKYKLPHSQTLMILTNQISNRGDLFRKYQSGNLKIKDLDIANETAIKIVALKDFYKGYQRSSFVLTMISLFKNDLFNFDEFLHKLKLQPTSLVDCTGLRQYKQVIEDIYNYKRREKVNLRF